MKITPSTCKLIEPTIHKKKWNTLLIAKPVAVVVAVAWFIHNRRGTYRITTSAAAAAPRVGYRLIWCVAIVIAPPKINMQKKNAEKKENTEK